MKKLRLPASGTAEEILAAFAAETAETADTAGEAVPEPGEPLPPAGPERLYALADRLIRQSGRVEAAPVEVPKSWVTFDVAGEVYGLPVECVDEALRVTTITRLPYAPAPVRGMTQVRGRILPVVDLRVRLGHPPIPTGDRSRILMVSSRGRSLGLLVDAARQVVKLLPSALEPPPPEVMTGKSSFIVAVCRREDSLLLLLDVEKVLLVPESPQPESPAGLEA
jgi:purine-binding chemotaxis protein CheW